MHDTGRFSGGELAHIHRSATQLQAALTRIDRRLFLEELKRRDELTQYSKEHEKSPEDIAAEIEEKRASTCVSLCVRRRSGLALRCATFACGALSEVDGAVWCGVVWVAEWLKEHKDQKDAKQSPEEAAFRYRKDVVYSLRAVPSPPRMHACAVLCRSLTD
jgi:hypothetical protein